MVLVFPPLEIENQYSYTINIASARKYWQYLNSNSTKNWESGKYQLFIQAFKTDSLIMVTKSFS